MKTNTILKTLAVALLMPAMLLTTACSNEDDLTNNTVNSQPVANKGYALPVTVNATRGGDATRATFDGSKLNFSTGDKLFVYGSASAAGSFAGELTWQSGGTFSGTIYTQEQWTGTAGELFTAATDICATLLPNNYESTGFLSINNNSTTDIAYDDRVSVLGSYAFVASETAKATGVEQLSLEQASTYSSGFALSPGNAILNFTISGLEAVAKDVLLHIHHGFDYDVFGSVTPNASGVATFAIGVPVGANIKDMSNNLTVGSSNFTLPSTTTFAAGKIYNITRGPGKFTINSSGTKVVFSPGNLQYQASTDTWRFAEHQYDYVGDDTNGNVYVGTTKSNNASIGETYTGWIDLFGWGTSGKTISNYGSAYQPWSTSTTYTDYGPTGTYNLTGTYANGDWGVNIGTGWRTLTGSSGGEWEYLFNKRTTTSGILYAKATVNGVSGVILLPDDWSESYHSLTSYNTTSVAYDTNTISESDWSSNFEAHGCVFLPAAGYRRGTSVNNVGSSGNYWSSTASDTESAYCVIFNSGNVYPAVNNIRNYGFSVRLVRPVQPNN